MFKVVTVQILHKNTTFLVRSCLLAKLFCRGVRKENCAWGSVSIWRPLLTQPLFITGKKNDVDSIILASPKVPRPGRPLLLSHGAAVF